MLAPSQKSTFHLVTPVLHNVTEPFAINCYVAPNSFVALNSGHSCQRVETTKREIFSQKKCKAIRR